MRIVRNADIYIVNDTEMTSVRNSLRDGTIKNAENVLILNENGTVYDVQGISNTATAGVKKLSNGAVVGGDTGGNTRGAFSFEFQASRAANTQVAGWRSAVIGGSNNQSSGASGVLGGKGNVASGYYSAVVGGTSNTASTYYAAVIGGKSNTASGQYTVVIGGKSNTLSGKYSVVVGGVSNNNSAMMSVALGGSSNTLSGRYSIIAGGQNNTVNSSAQHSVILGGVQNTMSAYYSVVMGKQAATDIWHSFSIASGRFSTSGDAQVSLVVQKNTVNQNGQLLYNGNYTLPVGTNKMYSVTITIVGKDNADNTKGIFAKRHALIYNNNGTTALVGSVQTIGTDIVSASLSTTSISITANNTTDSLDVQMTAPTGVTMRCVAYLEVVMVM